MSWFGAYVVMACVVGFGLVWFLVRIGLEDEGGVTGGDLRVYVFLGCLAGCFWPVALFMFATDVMADCLSIRKNPTK